MEDSRALDVKITKKYHRVHSFRNLQGDQERTGGVGLAPNGL
ncbi:hypothetical protein [Enterococcus sp. 2201sp1_2201st1_B8_2201SCRN_220225]